MERYIVLRILLALFVLFTIIFFVIRLATSGGDDESNETEVVAVEDQRLVLGEQNNSGSVVEFTMRGKTVAAENHRQIRFTISQSQRRVEIISGYDGKVIDTMRLPNTANAYQEFLYAIEEEGFMTEKSEPTITDRNGVCGKGKQYHYKVKVNGQTRSDLWSASCSRKQGTFGGDRTDIRRLFERQFPEYSDFTRGVKL